MTTISREDSLRKKIEQSSQQITDALPQHVNADKFMSVAMSFIFSGNDLSDKLVNANHNSVVAQLLLAAADGLMVDGRECIIKVYSEQAKYEAGVYGIMKKIRNSGEISTIGSEVVYANDDYDHWTDEKGEHFKHRKARIDRGGVRLTYAYAIAKDGGFTFEEIEESDMENIKACSKGKFSPWHGKFENEMRRKSAIKRLSKRLPMSTDAEIVLRRDDDLYTFNDDVAIGEEPKSNGGSRLKDAMGIEPDKPAEPDAIPPQEPEPDLGPPPEEAVEEPTGPTVKGKIEDIKVQEGKKKDGTPWRRCGVRLGEKWYGTFSKTHYEILSKACDASADVCIEYSVDGKYLCIESVSVVSIVGAEQLP